MAPPQTSCTCPADRSQWPAGVVCDDRAAVRRRVSTQLERAGIGVAGGADSFVPLLKLVLRMDPDVAVVTLPLAGTSGMTAVRALRAAAPGCEVVVLSAIGNLEGAAREAGALAVLPEDDPRALAVVLAELVRRTAATASPPAPPQPGAFSLQAHDEVVSVRAGSAGSSRTKPCS